MDFCKIAQYHNCRESSVKTYIRSYKWLCDQKTDFNYDNVLKIINDSCIKSKRSRLNGIIKILDYNQKYNDLLEKLKLLQPKIDKEYNDYNTFRDIDNTVIESLPSWNDMVTKKKEYDMNPPTNHIERQIYLFLSILLEIPPLRNEDYCSTKIIKTSSDDDDENNYLILSTNEWILRKGKTSKNGIRKFNLSDSLMKLIKSYAGNEIFLFQTQNSRQMKINHFGNILKKYLSVSCSMLRNIYVSYRYDQGITGQERKTLAKNMGHAPTTQATIYAKLSKGIQKQSELDKVVNLAVERLGEDKLIKMLNALCE